MYIVSNQLTKEVKYMIDMIPIVIDNREYVLRVVKDKDGKVIKGNLCLPLMGGLAMLLEGDE